MTDKELKNILQSSTLSSKDERFNDADFTKRVMSQCSEPCLEHSSKQIRTVVWTIRIVAAVVAIIVLFLLTPSTLTSIQSAIFNLQSSIEFIVSTFSFSSGSYLFALTSCLIIALLLSRRLD